mmetsp:Transcript_2906/g.9834  ORF Transcript_2906/g.9834 Transcript_2906/m.9834 type:complete len:394 (-) Transcript_2906:4455-5636(-)
MQPLLELLRCQVVRNLLQVSVLEDEDARTKALGAAQHVGLARRERLERGAHSRRVDAERQRRSALVAAPCGGEHGEQHLDGELGAAHGRHLEQQQRGGRQPVEARGDERLDGRREVDLVQPHQQLALAALALDEPLVPHRQRKLHREERVAGRAVHHFARNLGGDGLHLERDEQQLLHLDGDEPAQLSPAAGGQQRPAVGRQLDLSTRAHCDQQQQRAQLAPRRLEQLPRGGVHPVHVLEDEDGAGGGELCPQHAHHQPDGLLEAHLARQVLRHLVVGQSERQYRVEQRRQLQHAWGAEQPLVRLRPNADLPLEHGAAGTAERVRRQRVGEGGRDGVAPALARVARRSLGDDSTRASWHAGQMRRAAGSEGGHGGVGERQLRHSRPRRLAVRR